LGVEYIDPDKHIINHDADVNGKNIKFNGNWFDWTVERAKNDPRFSKVKDRIRSTREPQPTPEEMEFKTGIFGKTASWLNSKMKRNGREPKNPENELVRIWNIWDHTDHFDKDGKLFRYQYYFIEGITDTWAYRAKWPQSLVYLGGPYSYLQLRKSGNGFYKIPLSYNRLDANVEINEAFSHNRLLRRQNKRKVLYYKGLFDDQDEEAKLDYNIDNVLIKTDKKIDPTMYKTIDGGGLSSADLQSMSIANGIYTELSGLPPEAFNFSNAPTAQQSQFQAQSSNSLMGYYHSRFIDFLSDILTKMGNLIMDTLVVEHAINLIGEDGGKIPLRIQNGDELRGIYNFQFIGETSLHRSSSIDQLMQNKTIQIFDQLGFSKYLKRYEFAKMMIRQSLPFFDRTVFMTKAEADKVDAEIEQEKKLELQAKLAQTQLIHGKNQQSNNISGVGQDGNQVPLSQGGLNRSVNQQINSPNRNGLNTQ